MTPKEFTNETFDPIAGHCFSHSLRDSHTETREGFGAREYINDKKRRYEFCAALKNVLILPRAP
jgi:hypothetical protein